MLPKRCQRQSQTSKSMDFSGVFSPVQIIPTRQMKPLPKHFCFGHLISFDSDWFALSLSYVFSEFLLSKSYQGMLSFWKKYAFSYLYYTK